MSSILGHVLESEHIDVERDAVGFAAARHRQLDVIEADELASLHVDDATGASQ